MSVCPNINMQEWKDLEASVGRFEAMRDFMEYNGEIRTPEEVQAKLATRDGTAVFQLERTDENGQPVATGVLSTMLETLSKKFGEDYGYKVVYESNLPWKGMVEAPNETNGGKPTILINGSKATLDTPLHEFGHIFIHMIKTGNMPLYGALLKRVFKTKEGSEELARITELYKDKEFKTPEERDAYMKEETIVQLLGLKSAELIDSKTGLYKALSDIWDAILKVITNLFKEGDVLDVVDISPDARIEALAKMLAHEDLMITHGTAKRAVNDEKIKSYRTKIEDLTKKLNLLKFNMHEVDYVWDHNSSKIRFMTKEVNKWRSQKLPSFLSKAKRYMDSEMRADVSKLFAHMVHNTNENFDEALADEFATGEFKSLFWFVDTMKSDSDKEYVYNKLKNTFHGIDQSGDNAYEFYSLVSANAKNDLDFSIADVTRDMLAGDLTHRFGANRKGIATVHSSTKPTDQADVQKIIDFAVDSYQKSIAQYEAEVRNVGDINRHQLHLEKTYEIDVVDPQGNVVKDRIKVNVEPATVYGQQILSVAFSSRGLEGGSAAWGYSDPYWVVPYEPGAGVKTGESIIKIKNTDIKGLIHDVLPDGKIVVELERGRAHPHRAIVHYREHVDENGLSTGNIVLDPSDVDMTIRQRRVFETMRVVMQAVSELGYDYMYDAIKFDAASGSSFKRSIGEERRKLYDLFAKKTFGKYHTDLVEMNGAYMIPIPEIFKAGATISKDMFQVERESSSELPFDDSQKDSLIGHATAITQSVDNTVDALTNDRVRAMELANKLSKMLGIDYQMVTAREAEVITKDAQNPWSGESSFFVGGRVYFVGDHLSTSQALHEFAHPLVRSIAMENTKLFNNLFNQVLNTPEGQDIFNDVQRQYPDVEPGSEMFMEEVIVRALQKSAEDKVQNLKTPSGFAKVINNILYAIKQLLRKVFGKTAAVAKLDASTTMADLTDMLVKGDKLEIDTEAVSQEDVVAYMREQEEYVNDLLKVGQGEIQALINRAHDISTKHIDTLLGRKEYDELADLLTDEFKRGDLQEMKKNLSQYQTAVANMAEETKEDMEYIQKKTTALVNTIFRLDTVMSKVLLHMQDLATEPDTQDNLHKAYYYDYLVRYWEHFIEEANQALDDPKNALPANSPMTNLVGNISRTITRIKTLTNEMYADGARDTLYQELEPMNESIKARYEDMLANLKKRNAPQSKIDRIHKEYHGLSEADYNRMKELQSKTGVLSLPEQNEMARLERDHTKGLSLTPAKIEALLKGEMGDANFFNSYLEGYLYNTDPVIGGLALYVKNKMNEVMTLSQSKFNDFAKDMKPLLEEAGYRPSNIGELGKKVGFVDTVSQRDEDGNLVERKVWSLMNPFQNYRFEHDKLKVAVDQAQYENARTGTDESRTKLINAVADRKEFMRKYFNQQYIPEYYERESIFEADDIGKEAAYMRNNLFERMRMITEPATTESDMMELNDELDLLWREYRQLHSRYDMNGEMKTGKDLEIAKRLRQYREESRKFYEWKMRKGVFENALASYEQELIDKHLKPEDPEFKILRNEWIKKNTRTVIKDEFYTRRQDIIDRISEIMAKLPDTDRKNLDQTGVWEKIHDLTGGFRDDNGQPNATNMSEGSISKVKEHQEKLNAMRNDYMQRNGLTPGENARLQELHQLKGDRRLTTEELSDMRALYDKKKTFGLNKFDIAELDGLYEELSELSKREATDYYVDIMNNWFSKVDTDAMFVEMGGRDISRESADRLLGSEALKDMLDSNADFKQWFEANHIYKETFNKTTKEKEWKWERLYVWSVVKPNNEEYMETYDVIDQQGNVKDTLAGLPSMKYYARVVKPEYRTQRIVGQTVDNKGQWLPKTMEAGAADDRFVNKAYYNLQKEDPAMFNVLEKLKEHHLRNQEGLGYKSRLYLDFPRFRKSNLEVLQTKNLKEQGVEKMNALTIYAKRVKDFFYGAKDDAQSGFNDKDEFNLVRADMFDNEITNVPIAGLYDIEMDDVSTDITNSMMRYMLSAERQKQLVKISPVARAIQSVVNDPKNAAKEIDKVNKFNFINRGVKTYMNRKGMNVRKNAVNNFIEREFEGQRMTGAGKDVKWLNNTANLLFKRASFGFFALNIPSALKNSYGAKFQAMIEASAGKHMNHASLQKGNGWAYTTMGELSANQLYKRGPKSIRQQIVDIFDPSQGRFEEKFGESMSRTIGQDIASFSWLYNFRKWVELQATMQIFGGMMYHQKVKQFEGTENEKEISYMDAWELRDEKIQLKEGIDPKWGITYDEEGNQQVGSEFKRYRNKVHQTMNNLQGAYASFDQPEAQRYLAFRFLSYLRRYFTTMTLNRFGFSGRWFNPQPRMNPGSGDVQLGFYVEFLRTAKETITTLGRNLAYMTPEEKAAALKVMTEVGMLIATIAAMSLLFGWDPDDDDKFAKLRERSGALPFPFVAEDPDREFNGWGFVENHALYLLMNIRAENEQFIPLPGYGLDDFTAMLDLKSIAFGPTVKTYKELLEDSIDMISGDERAYYKRDVGPYEWQQQGGAKFWAHLTRTVGLTGSSLDPAKGIKGFQSVQARAR